MKIQTLEYPESEFQWIIDVISASLEARTSLPQPPSQLDCSALKGMIETHAIAPLIYLLLRKGKMLGSLSSDLRELLHRLYCVSAARATIQLAELGRLQDFLDSEGIRLLPWKGPVLSQSLFDAPGLRNSSDIDLLVEPDTEDTVATHLIRSGYQENCSSTFEGPYRWSEDHCRLFQHPELPVAIEIHRCPFPTTFALPIDSRSLFEHISGEVSVENQKFPVLSPEAELILLSTHAAKHGWCQLSWLVDIAYLLKKYPDLDATKTGKLADQWHCRRSLGVTLEILRLLFGTKIPDFQGTLRLSRYPAKTLAAEMVGRIAGDASGASKHPTLINQLRLRLVIRDSIRERIQVLAQVVGLAILPNQNDRLAIPGHTLPGFIAILVRPFRLLFLVLRSPRQNTNRPQNSFENP